MGKKRVKDRSSKEDEDIELTGPSCSHIRKGIDNSFMKRSSDLGWTVCQDCKERDEDALPQESTSNATEDPPQIWLCLKCGHRGCGRFTESQHALKHYETPRSDPHCLVLSMENWSVWCYICDEEVRYSRTGHLAQLVNSIKKQTPSDPQKMVRPHVPGRALRSTTSAARLVPPSLRGEAKMEESVENGEQIKEENKENLKKNMKDNIDRSAAVSVKGLSADRSAAVSVKGLSNLGNTCFFNAVIQNLSQTQLLRQILDTVTREKSSLHLAPAASSDLGPIEVRLDQPGSLTLAMCHLLNEIQESKKGVVTPRDLFTQVCKKAARFKGFQQQDSQELLRYLLDGMRAEEIKRVTTGISEALKQSGKSADSDQSKALIQEYEKNGLAKNFVDHVFGGELTSTVMCQRCKTVSSVTEMFLDLSLPVSDEAYRKKTQKKSAQKTSDSSQEGRSSPGAETAGEDGPSGAGSKYQQKKAKKQAKKEAKNQRRQRKQEGKTALVSLVSGGPAEGTPADHPDPVEGASDAVEPLEDAQASETPSAGTSVPENVGEEPDVEGEDLAVGADPAAAANRFTVLAENGVSEEATMSDTEQEVEEEGEEEGEEEEEAGLAGEMESMSLNEAFGGAEAKEYTVVDQDPELAFHTLASRAAPERQECSVQSCLFQFTEVETLTHNNSLLCTACTTGSKKKVYTDGLKQMLISSPPPVLTLHLKRFQQIGYSVSKVNRHVRFPQILDLAPFCAFKCKNVPEGGSELLYSLYGIVEHSGTMRSGHYTAYVKARLPCYTSNSPSTPGEALHPPQGSWFHVSDTSVQPVNESKAQSSQAYILFYERMPL